jgi:hypothetical protein
MTEGAEILLPTPIIFPPMIVEVDVGVIACGVDIASLAAAPDASVDAGCDPSADVATPL